VFATWAEAEAFLRTRTDYEKGVRVHGWRQDLAPVRELLASLGSPHERLRGIHVAGTKGKGSTATFASALLEAAGVRTGLYLSPHLERLHERVVVGGRPIGDEDFASALGAVVEVLQRRRLEDGVTFFDLLTAAAFFHFARAGVDRVVVEVGLGGRLDSTNAFRGEVAVVTNVDLEHVEVLGKTVEAIAGEKAGIVKEGATVVTGIEAGSPALAVLERVCREREAKVRRLGSDLLLEEARPEAGSGTVVRVRTWRRPLPSVLLPGPALYQARNLALALGALEALAERGSIDAGALEEASARVDPRNLRVPGRFEIVGAAPPVVLDGAHTPAAVGLVLESLEAAFPGRPLSVLFAAQADKDLDGMLRGLASRADSLLATALPPPRGATAEEIGMRARKIGMLVEEEREHSRALDRARALAGPAGVVLVTGSLHLVGAVRSTLVGTGGASAGKEARC
jgi:dihydrofolate synthase/folylpolyglutamate synthase